MSTKITLAALLLMSIPLAGLADDSSPNDSEVGVEKKSENRSQKPERESSDITLSKENRGAERDEQRKERRRQHKEHRDHRGKGGGKGGPNPSPDD